MEPITSSVVSDSWIEANSFNIEAFEEKAAVEKMF